MKPLSIIPPLITAILVVRCFMARAKRKTPEWRNVVYLPDRLLWFGLLGNVFVIPTTILLWRENWNQLWFVALCLLGWAMELAHANCWVRFTEQGFVHHTFFGRTYEFAYSDVTGIRRGLTDGYTSDLKLYCGTHLIFFDNMCLNLSRFMRLVDQKSKNLRPLPPRVKWDPYNHNVPNGKLNFFVLLLSCVLFAGVVGLCCWSLFSPPDSEETTVCSEATFRSCEKSGRKDFRLTAADGTVYGLSVYGDLLPDPERLCDGKTVYRVWATETKTPWIEQLEGPAGMIFTFGQKKEAYKNDQLWGLYVLAAMWLATLFSLLMSLRVGRHPERYRPWVWQLFFAPRHPARQTEHSRPRKRRR